MTSEIRRAIYERVRDKRLAAGLKFEDDPQFIDAIERWIAGDINQAQLRAAYIDLLRAQTLKRRQRREQHYLMRGLIDLTEK